MAVDTVTINAPVATTTNTDQNQPKDAPVDNNNNPTAEATVVDESNISAPMKEEPAVVEKLHDEAPVTTTTPEPFHQAPQDEAADAAVVKEADGLIEDTLPSPTKQVATASPKKRSSPTQPDNQPESKKATKDEATDGSTTAANGDDLKEKEQE